MRKPSRKLSRQFSAVLAVAVVALSCFAGCSSGGGNQAQPNISCDGISDCTDDPPVCGDEDTVICKPVDYMVSDRIRECIWRVSTDDACQCVEGEVRVCSLSMSADGVKTCVASSSTTTAWGACTAL